MILPSFRRATYEPTSRGASEEGGAGINAAALRNFHRPVSDSGSEQHASAFNSVSKGLREAAASGNLCIRSSVLHLKLPTCRATT